MASSVVMAGLLPPTVSSFNGGKSMFKIPPIKERLSFHGVIGKATGETSESSSSIVKSVQEVWDKSEDRIPLVGLGFAGIVAFWTSVNLITAIDKLPIIPSVLELIGILFSSWFVYRFLLFKPEREELSESISKYLSDILG
ncbi:hypothetical protein M569_01883 [Genlisea aurea]|uniref:Cyanobacterial aminoacyl-tRNA synthetase CAAD domain-containing protein n=1 Tax=Genlisea aurea TaxID=192259 RepID=S8EJY6_9LAMI|nr:hypothetical protein M569_01883 [Genlisea aurea]